jgi:hypothetical protein
MAKIKSTGTCALCGAKSESSEMSRHLKACLAKQPAAKKPERLFHIAVEGADAPEYWMHIEVPARVTLEDLDGFLRDTWLECCGHLSAFEIGRKQYLPDEAVEHEGDESMDVALSDVLKPGMEFGHQYDFGSTTALALRVVAEYEGAPPARKDEPVRVLARNDPPEIECGKCGKPAVLVCPECMYDKMGWLCKACAKKHENECEGGEMMLPVVNSPRVGVCGYCGPEDEAGDDDLDDEDDDDDADE